MHFGPESFVFRLEDASMEPRFAEGDYVYVDPDVPMRPGDCVAVRRKGTMTVRQLAEEDGRWVLRTLDRNAVDCVVTRDNETMVCGVVVFAGRRV